MEKENTTCKGIHHVAITVKDYDKSVNFYKDGLGFKEHITWGDDDSRACMLDIGNNNIIEIFSGRKEKGSEGLWQHLAFATDDCDKAFKRALENGARVSKEPFDVVIWCAGFASATIYGVGKTAKQTVEEITNFIK